MKQLFINDVINNIMEKIALRSWKKNWGSLSPSSEQILQNKGIWNPEKELKGLESAGIFRAIKAMDKNTNLKILENEEFDGSGPCSISTLDVKPIPEVDLLPPKLWSKLGPVIRLVPREEIYTGSADGIRSIAPKSFSPTSDNINRYRTVSTLHELDEQKAQSSQKSKIYQDLGNKRFHYPKDALLAYETAIKELPEKHKRLARDKFYHTHPSVLTNESNNIRFLPKDVRDFSNGMREETGEAQLLKSLTGKRYGKDFFSLKDAKNIFNKLK